MSTWMGLFSPPGTGQSRWVTYVQLDVYLNLTGYQYGKETTIVENINHSMHIISTFPSDEGI
jgi:hypothetical protein